MIFLEDREAHYQKFLGTMENDVLHSTDVKPVHIDIYTFPPTSTRPHYTLITGGMSDRRQNIPENFSPLSPRAELLTYASKPQVWMFNVLKGLAEMPWENNTFLHWYHSVPNGRPMTANPSELTAFLFVPPFFEACSFNPMYIDGDKTDFLVMVPITEREMQFKKQNGVDALLEIFDEHDFNYVIDESRKSFV